MLKLISALVACAFATTAHAAVIMKMKQESYGDTTKTCDMVMAIDQTHGRIDNDCGPHKVSIITVKAEQKMIMINETQKTYMEMDQKTLEKMQTDPMAVMKSDPRFSAQFDKMTPAQRDMMKKMMAGMAKKADEQKAEFRKIGKEKKVGSWSCTTYGIYLNGALAEDLCLADTNQFPDLKPLIGSWREFMRGWLKMARSPTLKAHEEAAKVGISVETVLYADGKMKSKTDLVEVKAEARPDSFFKVPADYKKTASPLGK